MQQPRRGQKAALITGSAEGLGWAIAERLAQTRPVILVDRSPSVASRAAELQAAGRPATGVVLDLADSFRIEDAVRSAAEAAGGVDVLVNNAGFGVTDKAGKAFDVQDLSLEDWNRVLAVNLTAMFVTCKALVPMMIEARWGRIVNMSSRSARSAIEAADVSYTASKAGVLGLTRRLALQLAPHGITVNALAPGRFQTALGLQSSPELIARSLAAIPAGRAGEPAEIGALVDFLISDEAAYITGAVLDINGGAFIG